jgi:hypothetical protein
MSRCHPDGPEPDTDLFMRYAEISEVLTDTSRKNVYDHLPKGKAWIDSRIKSMVSDGLAVTIAKKREVPESPKHYDWFARSACRYDCSVVQRWYVASVAVAPLFGYTRSIKVLLHDDEPCWLGDANILMIPRSWEPTKANAYGLFAVKVSPRPLTL